MRTIALTFADPEFLDRLHDAFPEAELVHVRLDQVAGIAARSAGRRPASRI